MTGPFNSVADVRKYIAELDAKDCPVAKRTRELREERERQARTERKAREQQRQAANISQSWWNAIDQRIREHIVQNFGEDGPLTGAIGEALGMIQVEIRKEFKTAIDTLRNELNATATKLHARCARLPIVKEFQPESVFYTGDVVVCDGATYQAKRDTGRAVTSDDWILLASAGRDGCDGLAPNICGTFDAYKTYARLDVVQCGDGNSYIARVDDPGICLGDGWQLMARRGGRGPDDRTTGKEGRAGGAR